MIENWKSAYKMASIWVFALAGMLAGLEQFLPMLVGKIPPGAYMTLAVLGVVARLVRQDKLAKTTPQEVWDEAMAAKEAAKK